jgi:hypothetical protein
MNSILIESIVLCSSPSIEYLEMQSMWTHSTPLHGNILNSLQRAAVVRHMCLSRRKQDATEKKT